jgi:SAM-dependent methyltransferase
MTDITRRRDCRTCGGTDLVLVLQLEPTPIGDAYVTAAELQTVQPSYPIDLYLCRACGLAQLLDVVEPELLYRDYIYLTGSSVGLTEHFRSYADDLLARFAPSTSDLVIDVGSNDGTLLRALKSHGVSVLGIDPARATAEAATQAGVETWPEFFNEEVAGQIRSDRGAAAIVTANNVFANIDDLDPILDGLQAVLAEDGVFVFESFYLADVVRNMVFDFIYHEHLSAFAVRPVQSFFARHGMELFDVQHVATKGGSMRYYVQRAGGKRTVAASVSEAIAGETEQGLYDPAMYAKFAASIARLKDRTGEVVADWRREGRTVAGFGASITGTTLIYHFGLGDQLQYLLDDNPAKQGRFSPGLHLPVYPGSELLERQPGGCVILAWRFVDPILRSYQGYLDQGGQFLVPVPDVRIL